MTSRRCPELSWVSRTAVPGSHLPPGPPAPPLPSEGPRREAVPSGNSWGGSPLAARRDAHATAALIGCRRPAGAGPREHRVAIGSRMVTSRRGGAGPREVRSLGAAGRDRRRHREPPPRPPGPPVSLGGARALLVAGSRCPRAGWGPGRERDRHRGITRGGPVPAPPSLEGRAPVPSGVGQCGPGRSSGLAPHTARHRGRARTGFSESEKRRDRGRARGGAARSGPAGAGPRLTRPRGSRAERGTRWCGLTRRW